MWTNTDKGREFITELAKSIITEVEPAELPLFDELILEYFADPTPPDLSVQMSDDPAGSGLGEIMVAVTPAAAAIASAVLTYILTEVIKTFQEESAEALKKKIKGLFRKKDDSPSPLTTEQLEQIRKIALKKAQEFGVEANQARQIANELFVILAKTNK